MMDFGNELKKAMIDKNISTANELSELCGVSYYIVLRLLKNDGTCRINDLSLVAKYLGVNTFELGESNE